jgi:ketosteroid isomerase-like protein
MDQLSLQAWLDAYGRAWETRDSRAVGELFSEDATYQETPFVEPMSGRAAIRQYWEDNVEKSQEQVQFESEILAIVGNLGIARWWTSFVRVASRKRVRLDGIFLLTFDAEGGCRKLQEWWMRQEAKADA